MARDSRPPLWDRAINLVKSGFGWKWRGQSVSDGAKRMADLLLAGGSMGFPGAWTADRIEQVRHYKGWTYVAVKAIAEEVACHPPQVAAIRTRHEVMKKGLYTLEGRERRKALASTQAHEELEPIDSSHPLCQLLRNPNEPDVSWDFFFETMMFLELTGNAYWWVVDNKFGVPAELWVIPSHWVWPMSGNGKLVDFYQVRPYGSPGAARYINFRADEIIPFRYKNPLSKIDGYAPIQAAAGWIDCAESIDNTRFSSFKNGIWPGMVMTLDPEMDDPPPEYVEALYARLDARGRGEGKYDRPLILPPGVDAKAVTRASREMDFTSSGDQLKDWILAVHKVGKSIAGINEDVNYASMIAATANFITRTIRPKLTMLGQVATEKLARRFDDRLVIYWPDLTPDDPAQKTADLQADFSMGAITPNEVRSERGRSPLQGRGDEPMVGGTPLEPADNPIVDILTGRNRKPENGPPGDDQANSDQNDDQNDDQPPGRNPDDQESGNGGSNRPARGQKPPFIKDRPAPGTKRRAPKGRGRNL